jgi:hypothetical protein
MYCVWKNNLPLDIIPLHVWENEWFKTVIHNVKKEIKNSRVYYGHDMPFDLNRFETVDYKIKGNVYSYSSKVLEDCDQIEIEVTDIPIVEYNKLTIDGIKLTKVHRFNTLDFNGRNIFYTNSGMVKIEGDFKKGDKWSLSVELHKLDEKEIIDLVAYVADRNVTLTMELDSKKREVKSIKNSKAWRALSFLRRFKKK